MEKRTEELIAAFRRAVSLNPNSAAYRYHLCRGLAYAGQDREAIEHGKEAIRLSPLDPDMALFLGAIGVSHYLSGRYAEAAQSLTEALRLRPGFQGAQRLLCASLARAGRVGRSQQIACDDTTSAARAFVRVDEGAHSLSNARAHGTLPGGHAESWAARRLEAALGQNPNASGTVVYLLPPGQTWFPTRWSNASSLCRHARRRGGFSGCTVT